MPTAPPHHAPPTPWHASPVARRLLVVAAAALLAVPALVAQGAAPAITVGQSTITDAGFSGDEARFNVVYSDPKGIYSSVVYLSGSTVIARESDGDLVSSGADATTVIQAALDALPTSGGTVVVRNAVNSAYTPIRTLNITKDNVTLDFDGSVLVGGDSNYHKFTHPQSSTVIAPHIFVNGADNVVVRGFRLVAVGANLARDRDGVTVYDSTRVLIEDCEVVNAAGSGIRVTSSSAYSTADPNSNTLATDTVTVQRCTVRDGDFYAGPPAVKPFGIEVEYSRNVNVLHNRVLNQGESPYRTHYASSVRFENNHADEWTVGEGFDLYRSDHVVVRGNRITSTGQKVACAIYEFSSFIVVEGNDFSDMPGASTDDTVSLRGVTGSTGEPIRHVVIRDNKIARSILLSNDELEHVQVVGNTIINGRIKIQPASVKETIRDFRIEGNTVLTPDDINVFLNDADRVLIRDNYFMNRIYAKFSDDVDVQGNYFTSDGTSFATALYLDGGNGYVRFSDNVVRNMTFQAVYAQVFTGFGVNEFLDVVNNHFHNTYTSATPGDAVVARASASNPDLGVSVTFARVVRNVFTSTQGTNSVNLADTPGLIAYNRADKSLAGSAATIIKSETDLNNNNVANVGTLTFGAESTLRRSEANVLETNSRFDVKLSGSGTAYRALVSGDAFGRWTMTTSGDMEWGSGAAARDTRLQRTTANRLDMADGDSFYVQGTWDGGHFRMGAYHLWVDASGVLRIKSGAPTGATDGTVVGAQT